MPAQWEEIALRKRQERGAKIPKEWELGPEIQPMPEDVTGIPRSCGILTEKELDITENYDARSIVDAVVGGRWTAEEIAVAFCKRAAIAQQLVNCLTEIFFDQAIERARYLDRYLQEHGKPVGPLHGLPISLKDSFSLPGLASTVGLTSRSFTLAQEHSVLSSMLHSAGAVLYVKTTTPQAQLALDTHSALWGRTCNPHNTALSAGGSSGGEAALIAMRGSVLGVGSDMAGSIRIPASCCGIYGVKPTTRRVPRQGTETVEIPGTHYAGLATVVGPIAGSLGDCRWFFEVVQSLEPWRYDAQVLPYSPLPPAGKQRLNIGILINNGITAPLPPVASMLNEVRRALATAGHSVELVSLKEFSKAFAIATGFMTLNGNRQLWDSMAAIEEPWSPWLAARMKRRDAKPTALDDYYKLLHSKQQVETAFLKGLWERGEDKPRLDVIICPTSGHPTTKHDEGGTMDWVVPWNLVDYPAGVMPVRTVSEADLEMELSEPSLGRWDDGCRKLWKKETRRSFVGAPMAVQVVGRKGGDGELCNTMEIIDDALRHGKGSVTTSSTSKL
ncbi:acetamidase [Sphaerosporella brunnea]|uniref:amidase n=1 Tax=Sphaerosporella brunnea TaxID=1250544 RepID=A0A5J5F4X5_9PEZI|nr:acetamidase [Sphaerosporella brunnea]